MGTHSPSERAQGQWHPMGVLDELKGEIERHKARLVSTIAKKLE